MPPKKLVYAIVLVAAALLAAPSGLSASHEDVEVIELVETGDSEEPYAFEPAEVTIEPGTTVRWVHTHDVFHTITSTDSHEEHNPNGEFDASMSSEGDTFEHTFEEAGTFHYYCKPHTGFMFGTITVEENGAVNETNEAPLLGALTLVTALATVALAGRDR